MTKKKTTIVAVVCIIVFITTFTGSLIGMDGFKPTVAKAESIVANGADELTDYSNAKNWLTADVNGKKPVDIFYLYPTAYQKASPNDPNYCTVDNVSMIKGANGALNRQATAFLPVGNIYAPYYRQADAMYVLTMPTIEEQDEAVRIIPAADGIAAFKYYLAHYNKGKPFILAGHSQGSNVLLFLLSELRKQPEVYKRMVAAYVIGFSVTKDYLSANNNDNYPKLKFATGPDDTGVIISYNTQAPGVKQNPVVRKNSIAINPISWTLTSKLAPKESNSGSITPISPSLSDLTPVKNLASAQIDTQRGVVVCSSVDIKKYSISPSFPGVYHSFDYPFYFYNIRTNALNRVQKYLATHK